MRLRLSAELNLLSDFSERIMIWIPNPTDDWIPRADELNLFHNVYIDESSQTKHRFLVIGGLIVASSYAKAFEDAITKAREGTRQPTTRRDGNPFKMKWTKCNESTLET